jgi:IS605 OrfB family transposase
VAEFWERRHLKEVRLKRTSSNFQSVHMTLFVPSLGFNPLFLENLKGIRSRIRANRSQRATLNSWAFHDLVTKTQYKADLAGVIVVLVDPRNSSRECSKCGLTEKANRPSQAVFRCQACGYVAHADINAAVNLSRRANVMLPNAGRIDATHGHAVQFQQGTRPVSKRSYGRASLQCDLLSV